jgi:hypothetical protein
VSERVAKRPQAPPVSTEAPPISDSVTQLSKNGNMHLTGAKISYFLSAGEGHVRPSLMNWPATSIITRAMQAAISSQNGFRVLAAAFVLLQRVSSRRNDVYNLLWAVVFGFATLNILSLAARRFEPNRRGLTFGEMMAVLVVLLSVFLLGWELLSVFHIFPIKLQR